MASYRMQGKKKLSLWQDIAPIQRELQKLPDTMVPKQIISHQLKALPGLVTSSPYAHSSTHTHTQAHTQAHTHETIF